MEENRETAEKTEKEKADYVDLTNLFAPPAHVMEKYIQNCADNIQRVRDEQEVCRKCTGEKCLQAVPEMVHIFTGYRGYPYFPLTDCSRRKWNQRKQEMAERKESAWIPRIFQGKSFGDCRVTDGNRMAVRMAREMVSPKENGKGLYLYGGPGIGKTFLASIVGNTFLRQGKRVLFTNTKQLRYQFRENLQHPDHPDRKLETVDLLIIDDLGAERFNAWGLEQLARVIDSRYRDKKLTLVTSNYGLKNLGEKMAQVTGTPDAQDRDVSARICSRLAGMTLQVQMYGLDQRMSENREHNGGLYRENNPQAQPVELFANS